jgi:xanthine/uracil/vitamin C permease (AzgA family)
MAYDNSLGIGILVLAYMLWNLVVGLVRKSQPPKELKPRKPKTSRKRSRPVLILVVIGLAIIFLLMTATAVCNDGSLSWSSHHSGTCSWHGGVSSWR